MPNGAAWAGWQVRRILAGATASAGYEGFHLLLAVTDQGVITGFGFGSASTHDQHLAATLFAARHTSSPHLLSAGSPAHGSYVADKGFAGDRPRRNFQKRYQVDLITPPHQSSKQRWPKALRRWLASLRQIIETVNDKLLNTFRLARERPHNLTGFQARLAAKGALHHFCIWFNSQRDEAPLAFSELLAW
jgi:DDE family transposase